MRSVKECDRHISQLQTLKNPLFIGLISLQLVTSIFTLFLSIQPGNYPLNTSFFFTGYAIIQIGLGIVHVIFDFDKHRNRVLIGGFTIVLAFVWILANYWAIWESAVINTFPYVPGKVCANVSEGPYYCPELRQVADTMISEIFMLMGVTFVGFVASVVLFLTRLRRKRS